MSHKPEVAIIAGSADETVPAGRFDKARSARSSAMLEDYTELIADLQAGQGEARMTDIARAQDGEVDPGHFLPARSA